MGVACYALILSTRKGKYAGHLQWYSMRKYHTSWSNIYVAADCGSQRTFFAKYEGMLVVTDFPTKGP